MDTEIDIEHLLETWGCLNGQKIELELEQIWLELERDLEPTPIRLTWAFRAERRLAAATSTSPVLDEQKPLPLVAYHKIRGVRNPDLSAWLTESDNRQYLTIVGDQTAIENLGETPSWAIRLPASRISTLLTDVCGTDEGFCCFEINQKSDVYDWRGLLTLKLSTEDLGGGSSGLSKALLFNKPMMFLGNLPTDCDEDERMTFNHYIRQFLNAGRLTPEHLRDVAGYDWLAPDLRERITSGI